MKYSVITPTYNSFEQMSHYFASVMKQKYSDFELIFVDDCSTDDTFEKLRSYCNAEMNNLRWSILKTPHNMGPGGARNIGMENACGDWIVFIDSDDGFSDDFFDVLERVTMDSEVNFIIYDSKVLNTSGLQLRIKRSMYGGTSSRKVETGEIISGCIGGIRKCFRRNLLIESEVRFQEIKKAEDFIFYCELVSKYKDIHAYYCSEPIYHIYQHEGSLSRGFDDSNVMKEVYAYLKKAVAPEYLEDLYISSIRVYLYGGALQLAQFGASRKDISSYVQEYSTDNPNWYIDSKKIGLNRIKKIGMLLLHLRLFSLFKIYCRLQKVLNTKI